LANARSPKLQLWHGVQSFSFGMESRALALAISCHNSSVSKPRKRPDFYEQLDFALQT